MNNYLLARRLALSIIDGLWQQLELENRLGRAFGQYPLDVRRLAARLLHQYDKPPLATKQLATSLLNEPLLTVYWSSAEGRAPINILLDSPVMATAPGFLAATPLPQLATTKDLARWLALQPWELRVLADCQGRQALSTEAQKHHYRYRWVDKRSGGKRLIEIPKSMLKQVQRQILDHIVSRIPTHDCAHGFVRERSCLSHVRNHINKPVLLQLDLRDFFHSIPVNRIFGLFSTLGYPPGVARLLAGLCTHASAPALVGSEFSELSWTRRKVLQCRHLPQGAPTSGALANLCAFRFDCRLQGLARKHGLDYSRYADDITFSGSGKLRQQAQWIEPLVGAIAMEEGFALNFRKTRIQGQARRQQVTGLVVNSKPNIPRAEYDRLKAILYNCRRFGAGSQNRDNIVNFRAHLAGRIARFRWINKAKGDKLQGQFDAIDWNS